MERRARREEGDLRARPDGARAVSDPKTRANGVFSTIEHPEHGPFQTVAPPFRLSSHEMHGTFPAPDLNAHTREVLEEAGVDPDMVELLASVGEQ